MATWYTTGTVSVTNGSQTVTGSGTAWVANTKPGEAFRGPDDRLYEIESVVSDTSLTLADEYLGANQSGQEYAILPVRGVLKQAYDALTSAIATMNGYIGTSLAGRFGFGSASAPGVSFDGDTDTGFYRAAANQLAAATGGVRRFLLSTTEMRVDVPVTGAAVQASPNDFTAGKLMRADYGYGPGNLLGTVSQSGGVPTGALIESGSNANGRYQKFACGTMICYGKSPTQTADTQAVSGGFLYRQSAPFTWGFPASFADSNDVVVTPSVRRATGSHCHFATLGSGTLTNSTVDVYMLAESAATGTLHLKATGRWF